MGEAYVEILHEDGTVEQAVIEGDQVIVGRAPSAGISLPDVREMEAEHILLAPRGDGCWVAVAEGARAIVVADRPFERGMVAWGTELTIGAVKLRLLDAPPGEAGKAKKGTSPIVLLAAVILPVAFFMLMDEPEELVDPDAGVEPPALFEGEEACDAQGGPAQHRAQEDLEAARAKGERYPFAAQDGVQSVIFFRRAKACFDAAGDGEHAGRAAAEGVAMERRLDEDYMRRRLRLERSLKQERWQEALVETRALRELLAHRRHRYVTWLGNLQRQLELRRDREGT